MNLTDLQKTFLKQVVSEIDSVINVMESAIIPDFQIVIMEDGDMVQIRKLNHFLASLKTRRNDLVHLADSLKELL